MTCNRRSFTTSVLLAVTLGFAACEDIDSPSAPLPPSGSLETADDVETLALETGYAADAFGTRVKVGQTVTSSETAPTALACAAQPPAETSNTVATVNLSSAGRTGLVTTKAEALRLSGSATAARATSTVHTVNLLDGLITASEVKAVSTTRLGSGGFRVSAQGSAFTRLTVNGTAVATNVRPNTRVDLPGFGYVILNEQVERSGSGFAELTVNMIHVVITRTNVLGIPVNSNIVVAHAHSRMQQPGPTCVCEGPLSGFAYGSEVAGSSLQSGKTAHIRLPCNGTDGEIRRKTVLTVEVPDVMTLGQVVTTAQGTVDPPSAEGQTSSRVERVDLLDGLVTAEAVRAVARVSTTGGPVTTSTSGTGFVNLHVAGHPEISANPPPNTKVELSGLGTLWLRRVSQTSRGVEVRMIELIVEQSNAHGLPIGTRVRISVAKAAVR